MGRAPTYMLNGCLSLVELDAEYQPALLFKWQV